MPDISRTTRTCGAAARSVLAVAALLAAACATPAPAHPPAPSPIDMQRGWKIYTYADQETVVGVTTLPEHPSDATRPNQILDAVPGAFCRPILDEKNELVTESMRDFCRRSTHANARVVLAPAWGDEVPPYSDCFIHCVCEGRAPKTEDAQEQARESATGPCTNRLNCRLDCPQP